MIKVSLEKDKLGNIQKVIVQGHACYEEAGEFDIVCAGVSALTITLLNGFETVLKIDEKMLKRTVGPGYTEFQIPVFNDDIPDLQVKTLTDVYASGIRSMAEAYSDYITVIENCGGEYND